MRAALTLTPTPCSHAGGHTLDHNVIFDWVRETQDHGPINTWDRTMYLNPPSGSVTSQWRRLTHNLIFNGPSANRDLGNLFPTVDNDGAFATALCDQHFLPDLMPSPSP